jgi:DNA polymerase-3 subunit delta
MNLMDEIPAFAATRGGVFYLHGDDEFRKEEAVRALVEAHLDPATRDFNYDPLRGREVDTETLASVLATPPMMAEWRVVVVREVEGLAASSRSREVLLSVAATPPPGLALVLSCTVPQGSRAKFYRQLEKGARSAAFKSLAPEDVPGWILERARVAFDIEVDLDAAQALAAAVGANLGVLARELDKLVDFVGDRRRIAAADVEAAGTRLPSQNRWAWFDMVGEGRLDEALSALGVLMGQGETGVGLVIGLGQHLLRLGVVSELGPAALEETLPPNQRWTLRKLPSQARRWSPDDLEAALEGLLRVDRLLKASPISDQHLLEEWLLALLARKAAA